jgi:hypothetical protein
MLNSLNKKMEPLLSSLSMKGYIKSDIVYNSMLQVDRGDFTESKYAYDD